MINLPTRIVTYSEKEGEEPLFLLELSQANYLQGIKRTILIETQALEMGGRSEVQQEEIVIRMMLYPSLISAVRSQTGFEVWPISYQDFTMLPESFVIEWEQATFELNPNWRGVPPLQKRKAEQSSNGSSNSSKRKRP